MTYMTVLPVPNGLLISYKFSLKQYLPFESRIGRDSA